MILWFLLLLTPAQPLTWYELYARGEKAYKSENYQACFDDMQAALALSADTRRNAFTRGVQKIDYDPHFYLALCLFQQGRIREAYLEAQTAFSGEVVRHTPAMQAELAKVFDAYRIWVQERHRELEQEEARVQLRRRISELVSRGQLDEADALIPASDKDENFADLRALISQRRLYDGMLQRLVRDFSEGIRQLLAAGDPKSAQKLLDTNRKRLPEALVEELSAQIRQAVAAQANRGTEAPAGKTSTDTVVLQQRLQELDLSLETMRNYVGEVETRNQSLSQALTRRGVEVEPPDMRLGINLSALGGRKIGFEGYILTALPIKKWQLRVDGQPIQFPKDSVKRTLNGYEIRAHLTAPDYGSQLWRLEVTDQLGRLAELEKELKLVQPWWLSRLTWGTAIALLTATFGLGLHRRIARKRRARLHHFNPYIAGSPIRAPEMFFGRELLLRRILGSVHKNSFMIHGDRRIGKTSLLCQLKRSLEHNQSENYGFYPAFIDLQGIHESDLFHHILMELLHQGGGWRIELGDLDVVAKHDGYSARDFSRDLQRIISRLREKDPRHVVIVLLIDEVDVLNEFGEKTNQKLRSIFMKEYGEHLTCVMAGIHLKKEWESSGSPWYNFFEEIPIQPFDEATARDLITKPVQGVFRYEPEAIDHLILVTGGLPYLIQKICVGLVNHKLVENRFTITKADVAHYLAGLEKEPLATAPSLDAGIQAPTDSASHLKTR